MNALVSAIMSTSDKAVEVGPTRADRAGRLFVLGGAALVLSVGAWLTWLLQ